MSEFQTDVRIADGPVHSVIQPTGSISMPLLWMAVRLSLRVAYPAFVVVMVATIAGTMSGRGPFYGVERGGTLVIFAQMAIGFGIAADLAVDRAKRLGRRTWQWFVPEVSKRRWAETRRLAARLPYTASQGLSQGAA